jgi:hypothetical protein
LQRKTNNPPLKAVRYSGENIAGRKREKDMRGISGKPEIPASPPKAKLSLSGEERIEKEVKPRGEKTGLVYLPP